MARDESGGLLTEATPRRIVDAGIDLPCWDGCRNIAVAWHVDHHWRRWDRWAGVPLPSSLPGDGAFESSPPPQARAAAVTCSPEGRWARFLAPLLPPAVRLVGLQAKDGKAFVTLSAPSADDLALALRRFDGSGEFVQVEVLGFTGRAVAPLRLTAMLDIAAPAVAAAPLAVQDVVRALFKDAADALAVHPVGAGFEASWRARDMFAGRALVDAMNRTPGFADAQVASPEEGRVDGIHRVRFRRETMLRGEASQRPAIDGGC